MRELRKITKIAIVPTDEGNATVVMNMEEYITNTKHILKDTADKQISYEPSTYLGKNTKALIKETPIDEETQQRIISREKSRRCLKLNG